MKHQSRNPQRKCQSSGLFKGFDRFVGSTTAWAALDAGTEDRNVTRLNVLEDALARVDRVGREAGVDAEVIGGAE